MFSSFLRDSRGNFAVLSAIMMTTLVGMAGLVTDYGNGLFNRLKDQRAADIAAVAGATIYAQTNSSSSMTRAVSNIAALNGYASSNVTPTLVSSPSGDGNQAVQVVVTSTVPQVFSSLVTHTSSLTVNATSFAEIKPASGSGCILALDPTAHQAITVSGSANLQAPNCDIISNSDNSDALDMSGSARMDVACSISVGGQNTTSGLTLTSCTSPTTYAHATADPYASLATPPFNPNNCLNVPIPPLNIPPGYYCHGISISTTASFQSGTFYVQGNLAFQGGSNVTANNVTFFVQKSGTTAISGSATVNLSAPTSGTYAGVLLFGDRNGSLANNNNISGSTNSTITGALYYPSEFVTFSGGSNTPSACTQVIGDRVTISGTAYLGDNCAGTGVANITPNGGPTKVVLVQ